MKAFLVLGALGVLFLVAFLVVWRGLSREPDGTNNRARGGGGPGMDGRYGS